MHERINRQDILVTHDKIMDMFGVVKVQQINAQCVRVGVGERMLEPHEIDKVAADRNGQMAEYAIFTLRSIQSVPFKYLEWNRIVGIRSNVLPQHLICIWMLRLNRMQYALYSSACLEAEWAFYWHKTIITFFNINFMLFAPIQRSALSTNKPRTQHTLNLHVHSFL